MAYGVFRRPPRLPAPSQPGFPLGVNVSPVNATVAVAEQDDTLSASATLEIHASLSITEADDVASASGAVDIVASAAITEGNDVFSGSATLAIQATAAISEASDAPSSGGTVDIVGSTAATEANDTLAANTTIGIVATAAVTEGNDTVDASALMPIFYPRRGGYDDRVDYERWLRRWQANLRPIIDQAWAIANGLIDPVTLEPIPVADLASLAGALARIQQARDAAARDSVLAQEARLQEEEAIAMLLLAA